MGFDRCFNERMGDEDIQSAQQLSNWRSLGAEAESCGVVLHSSCQRMAGSHPSAQLSSKSSFQSP
ncbi:hypothetical protein LEMLEM_LOCUS23110, partial [Lemmus lemmus]